MGCDRAKDGSYRFWGIANMLEKSSLRDVVVDRGRGFVFVQPQGKLDVTRCLEMFKQIANDVTASGLPRYVDLSLVSDFDLSFDQMGRLVKFRRNGWQLAGTVHCAIYADSEVGFGLARMYQALMDGACATIGVFRSRREAAAWLCVPEELLYLEQPIHRFGPPPPVPVDFAVRRRRDRI
jgi:hypothetical protein